jgi:hypothetical protein
MCADESITAYEDCITEGFYWNFDLSLCIMNRWDISNSQCTANGFSYFQGVYFERGRFDTNETCPSETCDFWEVLMNNGTSVDCAAKGYCTAPCPRCRSLDFNNGACHLQVDNETACLDVGGNYRNGLCILSNESEYSCTMENSSWVNCKTLEKSDCEDSNNALVMGLSCQWNEWDTCENEEKCEANGFCDDWDFGKGACIYKPAEPHQCQQNEFSTRTGDCVKWEINNEMDCLEPSFWTYRASNEQDCVSKGSECIFDDGFRAIMDQDACVGCEGESDSIYKWHNVIIF